jgi:hypothetical protein
MIVIEGSVRAGKRELLERKRERVALASPKRSTGLV